MIDPLTTAAQYVAAGLSVLPVAIDGTKRPDPIVKEWATYKKRKPTDVELVHWFTIPKGIGIIGGEVSGNLEILDIETPEAVEQWGALIMASEAGRSLLESLPRVATPSGGMHVYYRCSKIQGNQKLARTRLPDGKIKTVIETRGEGGYVIAPGSPPGCHESGKPYELVSLVPLTKIPAIGPDERDILLGAARAMDTIPHDALPSRPERVVEFIGPSVAEHYNNNYTWAELLQPNGWTYLKTDSKGVEHWQCAHSHNAGNCATIRTYEGGREVLHVFCTSAAGFSNEKSYSKFQAYAILEHMGDMKAAAVALRTLWGWKRKAPQPKEPAELTPVRQEARVNLLNMLGRFYNTDRSNAARLSYYYGDNIRYVPTRGWVTWGLGKWHDDHAGEVVELMKGLPERILEEASSISATGVLEAVGGDDVVNVRKELFKHAVYSASTKALKACEFQARSHPDLMVPQDKFDVNPRELNLINGVLDLETGLLREARPTDYFFRQANVYYDADAECPQFKEFLRTIFVGDDELIAYLQRALGYSLSGAVTEQCLFFCYGDGANGKSTLLDLIYHMLGDYSRSCPQHTFSDDKRTEQTNDLARLPGVRFLRSNEVKQDSRMDENLIKKVTGGDVITARLLNKEFFDFVPQFKIWIDGNHKPVIKGLDHGIWRRIHLIPFRAKFTDALKDPLMPEKLRAEIPGIFNWCVNGYQYWSAQGLMPPEEVKKATKEYRDDMDTLGEFMKEHTLRITGATTLSTTLYQAYCKWSADTGHGIMSQTRFGRQLTERGIRKTTGTSGPNKDRAIYHDIALRGRDEQFDNHWQRGQSA